MGKPVSDNVLYPDLSYRIMQIAFEVHNTLGPGFVENIYREAMIIEFERQGISVEREKTIQVVYKGVIIGTHRLDLIIDGKIVLELKAVTALNDVFKQQLLSYLKATGMRLGILINFGGKKVESVRIVN
ncbi:MAG: GxxExxY protein [Chloroflexi bacterium]|nr:GxxExxY protein [Chloroflexota bacterium]MBI3764847.1 GxxExxY protein [Chloroflexota bacterium]